MSSVHGKELCSANSLKLGSSKRDSDDAHAIGSRTFRQQGFQEWSESGFWEVDID